MELRCPGESAKFTFCQGDRTGGGEDLPIEVDCGQMRVKQYRGCIK